MTLSKPETKMMERKMELATFLEKEKTFCVVCRKHQGNLRKIPGFTEAFI